MCLGNDGDGGMGWVTGLARRSRWEGCIWSGEPLVLGNLR